MKFYRFILPTGGVLDLDFHTPAQAAAHAARLNARHFAL